jgi:hypothetical protein
VGNSLLSGEETLIFNAIHQHKQQVRYLSSMTVDHFVPSSRLTTPWLVQRFYDGGRSEMRIARGLQKYKLLLKCLVKAAIALVCWLPAPSEEKRKTRLTTAKAFLGGAFQEL